MRLRWMEKMVQLIDLFFFCSISMTIYSHDRAIRPHRVLTNKKERRGWESRENTYIKRFHCSPVWSDLTGSEAVRSRHGLGVIELVGPSFKTGPRRKGRSWRGCREGNVRVQVCPFKTHLMVMMVETSPEVRCLLEKVVFIGASLAVNPNAFSSVITSPVNKINKKLISEPISFLLAMMWGL